jgi:hydrogenase maturation factor
MKVLETTNLPVDRDVARTLAAAALTLAQRFAAGATMWCFAPQWPAHGRHVSVEFVHPVIVGKRALPAVNIEGPNPEDTIRLLARPGDVLLAISSADDPRALDVLARAQAWGLERFWLGAGDAPERFLAEHIIWFADRDPDHAARSGDIVLQYHLLWELTHVVFEQPGLLEPAVECTDEVCITCSDEGLIAEVVSGVDASMVKVLVKGHVETVDATLVSPVAHGDLLLVHAGVALTRIDGRVMSARGRLE